MHREETFARRSCAFANDGNGELEQTDHVGLKSIAGSALAPGPMHHTVGNHLRRNWDLEVNEFDSLLDRGLHGFSRVQAKIHITKIEDVTGY